MKKMLLVLLSITFLVSFLFMVFCQKKVTAQTEETLTETAGYGEKAKEEREKVRSMAKDELERLYKVRQSQG